MVKDFLIIGGVNTADFDIRVSREDTFIIPERDVTFIEVPGRNGDLVQDNGRWKNVDIPFHLFCFDKEKYNAFMRKIANMRGYVEIIDSEKPEEYRLGVLSAQVQPTVTNVGNNSLAWDLIFNCKPQRFFSDEIDSYSGFSTSQIIRKGHDFEKSKDGRNYDHYIEIEFTVNSLKRAAVGFIESMDGKDDIDDVRRYTLTFALSNEIQQGDIIVITYYPNEKSYKLKNLTSGKGYITALYEAKNGMDSLYIPKGFKIQTSIEAGRATLTRVDIIEKGWFL